MLRLDCKRKPGAPSWLDPHLGELSTQQCDHLFLLQQKKVSRHYIHPVRGFYAGCDGPIIGQTHR